MTVISVASKFEEKEVVAKGGDINGYVRGSVDDYEVQQEVYGFGVRNKKVKGFLSFVYEYGIG